MCYEETETNAIGFESIMAETHAESNQEYWFPCISGHYIFFARDKWSEHHLDHGASNCDQYDRNDASLHMFEDLLGAEVTPLEWSV